jgi:predicted RNase H-like HicB family nuclease
MTFDIPVKIYQDGAIFVACAMGLKTAGDTFEEAKERIVKAIENQLFELSRMCLPNKEVKIL